MAEQNEIADVVQNLIETCRDGQTGYFHAAAHATDPELKALFTEQSLERAGFVKELEDHVQDLGVSAPETKGSVAAILHRAWFELKADLGGGDQAIINSVEQGEDHAKKIYEEAVNAPLPAGLREVVLRQQASVRRAHDRVRDIRDAGQKAA